MPTQSRREDAPGADFHVGNRGIAKRPVFVDRDSCRYFLACLAKVVRAGLLEVHAYALLTTHFHLLVRSPTGELSRAMMLVENAFVRRFNRRQKRDGSLFRGRFWARRIEDGEDWEAVLRYIDRNPVDAGMALAPHLYPWCSAAKYVAPAGPIWLYRSDVERIACRRLERASYDPEAYRKWCERDLDDRTILRVRGLWGRIGDPTDVDLVATAPPSVMRWMQRKARLADGRPPAVALVSPEPLRLAIERATKQQPGWRIRVGRRSDSAWDLLAAGLLRHVAALSLEEAASHLGCSRSAISRRATTHLKALLSNQRYADEAASIIANACTEPASHFTDSRRNRRNP